MTVAQNGVANDTTRRSKRELESAAEKPPVLSVQPENIPDELKALSQWLLWRYERGKDRWAKVPRQPSGRHAKSSEPRTWTTFDGALAAYRQGGFDGIGFVFSRDDPYTGIDLDDCRDMDTGGLDGPADRIVRCLDSYAEVSPTGTGLKAWLRATKPASSACQWKNSPLGDVEVFDQGRYFAVTGHRLPFSPADIRERQAALDALLAELPGQEDEFRDLDRFDADFLAWSARNGHMPVIDRAALYLQRLPDAISGEHGHNATMRAARAVVYGFNLGVETGFSLMLAHYNQRCVPPWSQEDLRRKCVQADDPKNFRKPRGWLLVASNGTHQGNGGHHVNGAANLALPPVGQRIIQRASEVEACEVAWLWAGRIPMGKLTTFAGQTSQGKTFVACDIAARVTCGTAWPDGKPALTAGQVLYITGDDDADDTLVPRLTEAGARLDRVVFLTEPAQAGWTMTAFDTLDRALREAGNDVRLVVVDPPTSFLPGIDDHKNAELRSVLTPFKVWARTRRVAVVFITHVNKGSGAQVEAMLRVMGSVAWVTGVRTAYMFAADPECGDRQLFLTLKNNLAPNARSLAYRIVPGNLSGRVEWLGEVDTTADEALARRGKQPRGMVASEWLIERFRERLEWESEELFTRARQEGISRNAVFEAKRALDLPKPRKVTAQDGSVTWTWCVPPDWPRLAHQNNGTVETVQEIPW